MDGGEGGIRTPGPFPVNGFQDPTLKNTINLRKTYHKELGFLRHFLCDGLC
jgi:hypothetical protein